jgi:hypothetical protein
MSGRKLSKVSAEEMAQLNTQLEDMYNTFVQHSRTRKGGEKR